MPTLVILRHAKAERPDRGPDAERRLTARGHADAAAAGAWLLARNLRPGRVLCSPARRTRETWQGVRVALGNGGADVVYPDELYDGGPQEMLQAIQSTSDDVDVLMVVGHNPTVSIVSAMLDPSADTELRTAGLTVHRVDGSWKECRPKSAPQTGAHTARAG